MSLRILVVDDHPVFVLGLERLLRSEGLTVCGQAGTIEEGLRQVAQERPDVLVVDLSLPDGSGLQFLAAVQERWPELPSIVVSMHEEDLFARRALLAGARGYLMKDVAPGEIVSALKRVARGEVVMSKRLEERAHLAEGRRDPEVWLRRLSDREIEVFRLLGQSLSTRKIAERLELSVKTVETHQAKLKNKLGLSSMAELIRAAATWTDGGAVLGSGPLRSESGRSKES